MVVVVSSIVVNTYNMGTKSDDKTTTILRNLAVLFPTFYLLYYLISIIMVGSFSVNWEYLGIIPFDFDDFGFNVGKPLGTRVCIANAYQQNGLHYA